eukprot:220092-Rhodomonas_salina.1
MFVRWQSAWPRLPPTQTHCWRATFSRKKSASHPHAIPNTPSWLASCEPRARAHRSQTANPFLPCFLDALPTPLHASSPLFCSASRALLFGRRFYRQRLTRITNLIGTYRSELQMLQVVPCLATRSSPMSADAAP